MGRLLKDECSMCYRLPEAAIKPPTKSLSNEEFEKELKKKMVSGMERIRPEIEQFEKRRAESLARANHVVRWK